MLKSRRRGCQWTHARIDRLTDRPHNYFKRHNYLLVCVHTELPAYLVSAVCAVCVCLLGRETPRYVRLTAPSQIHYLQAPPTHNNTGPGVSAKKKATRGMRKKFRVSWAERLGISS